jgi:hypothetical protein
MDLTQENNLMDNLIKPDVFLSQISSLVEKLPHVLDDFIKYYIFYNKNPEVDEYQQMFENIKGNLQKLISELSTNSNNIEKNIGDINKKLFKVNVLIKKEKQENNLLKRKLGIIENQYDGSDELISNYKEIYNLNYIKNFALCIGIILSCILMTKTFTPPTNNQMKIK